ncbi:MAG: PQQ-binding-like beta-propeller repeat protein [Thermoguttaceae bacterium]
MQLPSLLLLTVTLAASPTAASDDWPQFRGPDGQGHSNATSLPLKWSESENVAWKAAVEGCGWSSPVVLGDQVWLTTAIPSPATSAETQRHLATLPYAVPNPEVARSITLKAVCLDRHTGRPIRSVTLFEIDTPVQICSVNSYASPTPVAEPGRLYCDFGTMGTACLDTASGEILWKRRLAVEHQVGPGSSPILHGEKLVLVRDGCDLQYVTALNRTTGETIWKTDRPPIVTDYTPDKKAFSTPLIIRTDGQEQMIVLGAKWFVAYDPESGKPIWQVDTGPSFSNAARPVFGHGLVFVCTAFGQSELLAVRVDGLGDVTESHIAWTDRKQVPKRSSPILVGDEVYTVSDKGVATCRDARTGETHWSERILGDCSASPVFANGRIYFFGEDGRTAVLQPSTNFVSLAENKLEGRIMASAAIADGAMFLRTDTHMYRIQEE